MSKTEIELRQAALQLMKVACKETENPTVERLRAYVRMMDAIIESQAAEKKEQDEIH